MSESPKERTDRQLSELLNELRVALPGAQVLLAFLLTAPFQTRFRNTSTLERAVLYAGILATASGVLLLMAPSVYHRVRWEEGGKEDVVRMGHKFFLAGIFCLAAGLVCALFVASNLLVGKVGAYVAAGGAALVVALIWFALPLYRRRKPGVTESE